MERGGQPGNQNATKNKMWRDALDKRLRDYNKGKGDSKVEHYWALQQIADKLIEAALDGDMQAIKEIGDRVDGKAVQAIANDPDSGPLKIELVKEFILRSAASE